MVGAGVGGTAVAGVLARCGHDVELLEQADEVRPVGAGLLMQPTGLSVLGQLGLERVLRERAEPIERLVATSVSGRPLLDLPLAVGRDEVVALGMHRGDLHAALLEHATAHGVRVTLGVEARGVDDRWVQAAGGSRHGPYDLVVAADGAASRLRRALGLARVEREYAHGALWAVGHSDAVRGRLAQVVDGTRELIGLMPLGRGRCNLLVGVRLAELPGLHARGFAAWRAHVERCAPASATVLSGISSFDDLTVGRYRSASLRSLVAGRVVLIGDAAHPMSPHLGQGANLALLDAWELACAIGRSQARWTRPCASTSPDGVHMSASIRHSPACSARSSRAAV